MVCKSMHRAVAQPLEIQLNFALGSKIASINLLCAFSACHKLG